MTTAKSNPSQVDCLIVGGGPAGLSAASTFSRLRRPTVVYDSGLYRNAQSSSAHTILGFEGSDPAVYRQKVRAEVDQAYDWTTFVDGKITKLVKAAEGFEAEDAEGNKVKAKSVILATGLGDVLPPIPGLQEAWGRRAVHCVFCHGTETRDGPFGFLLTPGSMFNPMVVGSAFTLWGSLRHPMTYFFTHGMDTNTPEGLKQSGLEKFMPIIQSNPDKYQVITDEIISTKHTSSDITITFANRDPLTLPYILVFPERMQPTADAAPLLTEELLAGKLTPMGVVPAPDPALPKAGQPRTGDDPRTSVPGLFWAGNSGSPTANVNIAVSQGQVAAMFAGGFLGEADISTSMAAAAKKALC